MLKIIKVLHTIAGLHPASGGPARTVTSLVDHLGRIEGLSVALATQKLDGDELYFGGLPEEKLAVATGACRASLKFGLPFENKLKGLVEGYGPDIVHDHGIWLPTNHIVAKLAAKRNVLRVVHTRGMLEPWAVSYRSYKKKLAWLIYQRNDLESAALFFATAEAEAASIRRLGFKQPIAVIPNGVDLLEYGLQGIPAKAFERQRNVVFMSRIHPVKGLIELLTGWAQVRPVGWNLILAGPDEGGHLQEVLAHVKTLGLTGSVEYRGVLAGENKAKLLKSADVFILPSLSENFGVVVAEALAYGIPVIATLGTPWQGLVDNRCGWWVAAEADALAGALSEAIGLSDEERHEMGVRGQQYARQFNWSQIARETADVYRWLLGMRERPGCVHLYLD